MSERATATSLQRFDARLRGGHWPPGTPLPAERALATQLGVSRAVLREQLRGWREAGLIDSRRGSGHRVAAPGDPSLSALVRGSRRGRAELLQVRGALDAMAAAGAAAQANDRELARIRRAQHAFERALEAGDRAAVRRHDGAFHAAIVAAAHNRVLAAVSAQLRAAMQAGIDLALERLADDPAVRRALIEQHAVIAGRIGERDADAAAVAAQAHTRYVAEALSAQTAQTAQTADS